jgi:hypothetical protein
MHNKAVPTVHELSKSMGAQHKALPEHLKHPPPWEQPLLPSQSELNAEPDGPDPPAGISREDIAGMVLVGLNPLY